MVYEKRTEILKALYKLAAFTVQAVYYDQAGIYIKQKAELISKLQLQEREILENGIMLKKYKNMEQTEFERLSKLLFNWAAGLIFSYKIKE